MALMDLVTGCVLGLVLGDALGAPFGASRAKELPDPLPAFELPWRDLAPGTTTHNAAMARNLVRSLGERGGFDAEDLMARHLEWFRGEPADVESLTGRVLRRVSSGAKAEDAARAVWRERGPEASAGNGSVAYCAPLGAAYANSPGQLFQLAPRLSGLTHFAARCRSAVLAVTLASAALVGGEPREDAVRTAVSSVLDRDGGEELEYLTGAVGIRRSIDGPDRGFCLFAAAAGLAALLRDGDVGPSLLWVVSLGGDTSANAAVAGALLGAASGRSGLPGKWLPGLRGANEIEAEAERLVPLAAST